MIILIVCGPELDILPACSWGFSNDSFRDDAIAADVIEKIVVKSPWQIWSQIYPAEWSWEINKF